jgi:hypothetical protein
MIELLEANRRAPFLLRDSVARSTPADRMRGTGERCLEGCLSKARLAKPNFLE